MPGPFELPPAPEADTLIDALSAGARARQILALGVGADIEKRRQAIYRQAELELRGSTLTPDRAFMHIACANALHRYEQELTDDVMKAQRAADHVHAEADESRDGDL